MVVLDFETTGLSPDQGDRAIEIGAVRIQAGEITDQFQALMNPGQRISGFIEDYTGISNNMLQKAAPCGEVMLQFADFIQGSNLVAHNASFDKRFLDTELARVGGGYDGQFACSMLAARRLYPDAHDHKLGSLIRYKNIPTDGSFHRALFDAQMTSALWLAMLDDVQQQYAINEIPFRLIQRLCKTPKKSVAKFLTAWG